MQLPATASRWNSRVIYGRYAARRLKRDGHDALARSARAVTDAVLAAGRALDDARFDTQDALADRDAADNALDEVAKDIRHALASRERDAVKKAPYTAIFPEGILHYTAATLDEEDARYTELRTRLDAHLPAKDPLRKTALARIDDGLKGWRESLKALGVARSAEALAGTALQSALDAFARQMVKTYGTLVASHGKAAAEQYFPDVRRRGAGVTPEPADDAPKG